MKTTSVYYSQNQSLSADAGFIANHTNQFIMKKLSNTSPFLLLLLPVFMMIILSLSINTNSADNGEIVVKPAKASTTIVKQATAIFK